MNFGILLLLSGGLGPRTLGIHCLRRSKATGFDRAFPLRERGLRFCTMQTRPPGSILGHSVRRREDPRLITGAGRYVDDFNPEGCLHAAFVRSTLAHGELGAVDTSAAAAAPGVVAVLTGEDLQLPAVSPSRRCRPILLGRRLPRRVARFAVGPLPL